MSSFVGRTLSHYRIEAEISRGGMGVVYRAVDLKLGREVALKVLAPELVASPELRRRFIREAQAAAALQHPHVAVVHEIDEADGVAFIAMELVRGQQLGDFLKQGTTSLAECLRLCAEIASALGAAHDKGIVHRDLKPANVLVTGDGSAKIIDFGIAKLLDPIGVLANDVDTPARHTTDPGRLLGTAPFMSPEQARGDAIDARSDVFSFGSLLYQAVTGSQAFRGGSAVETLNAVLNAPTPQVHALIGAPAAVRTALQHLIDACLEKDPEDRPQTMAEVSQALERARHALGAGEVPAAAAPGRDDTRLRVAIVDDEPLARGVLKEYLAQEPDVEIVAECGNGFEAVKAASETKPDVIFLDIQMPKLTGFEVLELIDRSIGVVFVTAYDEYALKAFEVHAIDYLLKPFARERLSEALARTKERLRRNERLPVEDLTTSARPTGAHLERVLIRDGPRVHVIPVADLDYVQAQDDYVSVRSNGKEYLKEQTLGDLERSLDPRHFVRIHRSYLLNVERLARIEPYAKDSRVAILRDGTRLPLSRSGYARLKGML